MPVEKDGVHVRRSLPVSGAGDGANERGMLELAGDGEPLAGLEVDADTDGKLGVAVEALLRGHDAGAYSERRVDTSSAWS